MAMREMLVSCCLLGLLFTPSVADALEAGSATENRPLVIVHASEIPSVDPHPVLTYVCTSVLGNIYEKLVEFDKDGRFIPKLATSWETPDDLTWVFHLRKGVQFHNGESLTSKDVAFSLLRAKNPNFESQVYLTSTETVIEKDEHVVVIKTSSPDPILLNKLAFVPIVPHDSPERITSPIGTGPYRCSDYDSKDSSLSCRVSERYWGKEPSESAVVFLFREDPSDRIDLLVDGSADLVTEIPAELTAKIEDRSDLWIEGNLASLVVYLALDRTAPPLDDPRIRSAVNLAIDREALVDKAYGGYARPAAQIMSRQIFGYAESIEDKLHDLQKAKALIKQAEYDGSTPIVIHTGINRTLLANIIVQQLKNAGINAQAKLHSWPDLMKLLDTRDMDVVIIGENHNSMDAGYFFDSTIHSRSEEQGLGNFNFHNFSDSEIDSLIESSGKEMNRERRLAMLQEVSQRLDKEEVILPLVWVMELYGIRRDLKWTPRVDGSIYAYEISRERSHAR